MKEYDYKIVLKDNIPNEDKPYWEFRSGNYNRKYTLYEIEGLYHACKKILKQEGYFGEEE
tara:strand:- start:227 stop:406 length:180 start_codon:yes stop_codon:yes gene_type:complete